MATDLQQALSKVQAPKISLEELRGKSFKAQAQNAPSIEQTNFGKQIPELLKQGGQLYGQHVDESWKQAKQWYDEAKLADKDPLHYAAQKAGEETDTLFVRAKALLQEGLDIDPLAYNRAYTAERQAEEAAFQADAMLQEKVKAGDFATVGDMLKERQALRKDIPKDVGAAMGLESTNAFILKGATRNDVQSEQALRIQQTASEDNNLRNTRKQIITSKFNTMLKQGVQDPKIYAKLLDDGLLDGTLNTNEHYQMFGQFATSLADTGNTGILNGFFNQSVKLGNGEVKKFGEVIPVEVRDGLFLKADNQYLLNNKEVYDEYSRQIGEVGVDMENGNTSSAMARIASLDAFLNKHQGSGRVTSQMEYIMKLRNQVLVGAARQNNLQKAQNDKLANNMHEQSLYTQALSTSLAGGIATTDWNALGITEDNARAATQVMLDGITNNPKLSPDEKLRQTAHLVSILPDRSAARKAFSEYSQRGIDAANKAFSQAQYSKNGEIPQLPVETEGLIKQYKDDPSLFQKVTTPEVFQQTAILANTVDRLGWDTAVRSKSQPLALTKDDKSTFDGQVADTMKNSHFTTPQKEALEARAKEFIRLDPTFKTDAQTSITNAVKAAAAELDSLNVTFDNGDVLSRSALIPKGRSDAVPLVRDQLNRKLTTLKKSHMDDILYLSNDTEGRISVISSYTGKALEVTTAEIILNEATDFINKQQEELKVKKQEELKKQRSKIHEANKREGVRPVRPSGLPYTLY